MSFSERHGYTLPKLLQIDSIDDDLTNGLWECLSESAFKSFNTTTIQSDKDAVFHSAVKSLFVNFLKMPSDQIPYYRSECIDMIRKAFFSLSWNQKFDLVEFCGTNQIVSVRSDEAFRERVNFFLEREKSAFRFVGSLVTRITSELEIHTVEDAISATEKYASTKRHIEQALVLYSDRDAPDYRNAMKEAISAVEALCRIVSGEQRATLASALKALEKNKRLHPSLAQAWIKLYAYTSDEGGVRHAMFEGSGVTESDALYMIVSCSAFINYVIATAIKDP